MGAVNKCGNEVICAFAAVLFEESNSDTWKKKTNVLLSYLKKSNLF